jgi:hypothetical protein
MKKCVAIAAAGLQALSASGQVPAIKDKALQLVTTGSGGADGFKLLSVESMAAGKVKGRPLSAREERHTLQVLGDGTQMENTETDKFYRDDVGRTRLEGQNGHVFIVDPVQGVTAEIAPGGGSKVHMTSSQSYDSAKDGSHALKTKGVEMKEVKTKSPGTESASAGQERTDEDLGYQLVNGVTAHGTRSTTVIPAGEIGNNRPIRIVSERWYSDELQMNVKTIHSDPRFGETTYQLSDIVQGMPDPALFKVPLSVARQ